MASSLQQCRYTSVVSLVSAHPSIYGPTTAASRSTPVTRQMCYESKLLCAPFPHTAYNNGQHVMEDGCTFVGGRALLLVVRSPTRQLVAMRISRLLIRPTFRPVPLLGSPCMPTFPRLRSPFTKRALELIIKDVRPLLSFAPSPSLTHILRTY